MRKLKVIPEERKKPWSSSNFFNTLQGRWSFFLNPFLHFVKFTSYTFCNFVEPRGQNSWPPPHSISFGNSFFRIEARIALPIQKESVRRMPKTIAPKMV